MKKDFLDLVNESKSLDKGLFNLNKMIILKVLSQHKFLLNREIRNITGLTYNDVFFTIRYLIHEDYVKVITGSNRVKLYAITDKGLLEFEKMCNWLCEWLNCHSKR